ncbi:uncharacterized protein EDB91DRAFT_1250978 [Suillus paluster]|uniref:uncharacterized protein n=1 Tax=Suillus paluster TaxID=48578 RepID=UPI001B87545F|nr:uncharacterized protein EDB91DRAFT_1250978 [Suillus paluster]KAG1734456.1 hypothetical protein EDB91DRAFT_1250978 [Suillus paluster]
MSTHELRNQPTLPRIKLELSENTLQSINTRLLELDVVKNTKACHFEPMCSIYATTVLLAAIITACPDLLDQSYARVEMAMQVLCQNARLQEDLREAIERRDFKDVLNIEMLQKPVRTNVRPLNRRRTL